MIISEMDGQCTDGQTFSKRKMVQDIYSSRTYGWIRRMVFVSLLGVSDLFSIMSDYSDGVWFREMMQLMLSDDTDSDDGARDLIMRYFVWL
jgi:hypothetical protein